MSFLIDTTIISEIRRGERCDARVAARWSSVEDRDLYLSTLVLGEIRTGVELLRRKDPGKAGALQSWLEAVTSAIGDRVLPVDRVVADEWGRMSAQRSIPVIDGMLAATAKIHGVTLVTRNASDVAGLGAKVLDPFVPRR